MNGWVLSHMRGKGQAFATEILIKFGRKLTQIRPRDPPNSLPTLESFGLAPQYILTSWWPGAQVEFDGYGVVDGEHRRPTHPEDALILEGSRYRLVAPPLSPEGLLRLVQPLTFSGISKLFPQMVRSPGSHSAYVPAGMAVERSGGYVRCRTLHVAEPDKMLIRDEDGEMCLLHILDQFLLQAIRAGEIEVGQMFDDKTARFSLADPLQAAGSPDRRCYMALTHVVF